MRSLKFIDQKAGRVVASLALLLSTVLPTLTPALAGAAQLTSRSVQLSSSTVSAPSTSYTVGFTTTELARAVAIQFCSDTPLIGEDCGIPTGLNLASANVPALNGGANDSLPTVVASQGPVIVIGDDGLNSAGAKTYEITGIVNPSTADTMYARIITYTGANMAAAVASATDDYDATDNDGIGGVGTVGADGDIVKDTGAVAISITDAIGVDAAVLETLSFCTASVAITPGCGNAAANPPNLTLGEQSGPGEPKALTSSLVSTGNIFTQLSTNASSGAVVSIKSNNTNCAGLALNGGSVCHIAAAGTTGTFVGGVAKFGLFVNPTTGSSTGTGTIELTSGDATVTGAGGTAWLDTPTVKAGDTIWTNGGRAYTVLSITSNTELELTTTATATEAPAAYTYGFGTYQVDGGGTYSNTDYRLDDAAVRSTYGDPLLNTNGGVLNGGNISLTFGASISNVTPAGRHSNAYSLIATGTF